MSDLPAICRKLDEARSLLLVSHVNPDGDALGSMLALRESARAAGRQATALIHEAIPHRYEFLLDHDELTYGTAFPALADQADLIVVLDTASRSQLGELAEPIASRADKVVILDHHATADDLAENIWRDTTASATGLMVLEAIRQLGWPLPDRAARALATAIYTDTGWLRFSNTDARACRAIAELIEAGVAPDELYQHIFQTDRPQRLALLQRVLASLELHCDDQLAVMTITGEDFAETGARPDETENLINEALRLGCVEVAVILVQNPPRLADTPEPLRVSLRSRSRVDVSQIASAFGGGGHARAAGLKSTTALSELKAQLIAAAREAL